MIIFVSRAQIVNGIDWSISFLAHLVFLVSEPLMSLVEDGLLYLTVGITT